MPDRVTSALGFVEDSEFRKQMAREIAKQIAGNIDLQSLIDQGQGYADDLIAALLDELQAKVLSHAALSAQRHAADLGLRTIDDATLQTVVDEALTGVMAEAIQNLEARIGELARTVARMEDAGVSATVISASLESEAGAGAILGPVQSVLTQTGAGMVNAVEKAVLGASAQDTVDFAVGQGDAPPLMEWETREDDRVCEDLFENSCAPRHGEQLTIEEWGAFGEPASENLICSIYAKGAFSNCRCVLRVAEGAGSMPGPINVAEAAARGKDRAVEAFANAA